MNLFTVQLLLSLLCNLSTALSESADGRLIYTCANAMTVGVRLPLRVFEFSGKVVDEAECLWSHNKV